MVNGAPSIITMFTCPLDVSITLLERNSHTIQPLLAPSPRIRANICMICCTSARARARVPRGFCWPNMQAHTKALHKNSILHHYSLLVCSFPAAASSRRALACNVVKSIVAVVVRKATASAATTAEAPSRDNQNCTMLCVYCCAAQQPTFFGPRALHTLFTV